VEKRLAGGYTPQLTASDNDKNCKRGDKNGNANIS